MHDIKNKTRLAALPIQIKASPIGISLTQFFIQVTSKLAKTIELDHLNDDEYRSQP